MASQLDQKLRNLVRQDPNFEVPSILPAIQYLFTLLPEKTRVAAILSVIQPAEVPVVDTELRKQLEDEPAKEGDDASGAPDATTKETEVPPPGERDAPIDDDLPPDGAGATPVT